MNKGLIKKYLLYMFVFTFLLLMCSCEQIPKSETKSKNSEVVAEDASSNSSKESLVSNKVEINDEKQKVQSNNTDSILEQQRFEVSLEDIKNNDDAEWVAKYNDLLTFGSQKLAEEAAEHGQAHAVNYGEEIVAVSDTNHLSIFEKNTFLDTLITGNWDETVMSKLVFDREKNQEYQIFRLYTIDPKVGVSCKVLNGKVFNLIFTKNYGDEVLEGISINSAKADIITVLGMPNFTNDKEAVFGYVDQDLYVFFHGEDSISEISVYRNDTNKGYDQVLQSIDTWTSNSDTLLSRVLENSADDYDWVSGVSSVTVYGYETKGFIIHYDEVSNQVQFELYNNASEKLKSELQTRNLEGLTIKGHDAIFDLEQYRVLIDQCIRGESIDERYTLGMAFESEDRFILSPNKQYGAYHKTATIDDNYACIYITNMSTMEAYDELPVDAMGAQIRWINDAYLACVGTDVSYVYNVADKKIISLPASIFGTEFNIVAIEDGKIVYTKEDK